MAGSRQPRSQRTAAQGASTGAAAKKAGAGGGTKKSSTRGGRPDAPPSGTQPGAGAARGQSSGQAQRPPGGNQRQRDTARQGRPRGAAAAADPAEAVAEAPRTLTAPLWLQLTTLVLSLIGLADSVYLTIAHYTSSNILACSDKGVINCAKVTTSPESIVFGIFPVAVLGLAFFVFMTAINTPWAWRAKLPVIRWARLASVIIGIVFVLYLVYTEVITLGNICLFCTYAHVVTFFLFGLIVFSAAAGYGVRLAADRRPQPRR
jgi:uncharacterized membrane protein